MKELPISYNSQFTIVYENVITIIPANTTGSAFKLDVPVYEKVA